MVAIKAIQDWIGVSGDVVSWHPSPRSRAKVAKAPVSSVPVSYQQTQHIQAFRTHRSRGTEMARLNIPAWDIPGVCDVRAMTHVINAYLRRHDTYHSWFEISDSGDVVRRTVENPKDIAFVATSHGPMSAVQWREHVLDTPGPLQWDCFSFGVIQRTDHFTFYIAVDHVHTDAMFMGLVLVEIHAMYAALASGFGPLPLEPVGRYDDYCIRQRSQLSAVTVETPAVKDWIAFAERNDGTMPRFPLPLGDFEGSGDLMTVRLMDKSQSDRFESACTAAGARFIGGVFACAGIAQYRMTGRSDYHVITPTTTRRTPEEFRTTGWFTGVVPVSAPVGSDSFAETAKAAQHSFDSRQSLADIPFDRVLEVARDEFGLRPADPGVPMVSFLDAGLPPLSPEVIAEWERMNGKVYSDARCAYQVSFWVNRGERETTVTFAFPNNDVARDSVTRYVEAMAAVYLEIADGVESAAARGHSHAGVHRTVHDRDPALPVANA